MMEIPKDKQKLFREFAKKIAPIYKLLGWHWGANNGAIAPPYIPNEKDLLDTIEMLYRDTVENKAAYTATGGLTVGWSEGDFYVEFAVADHIFDDADCPCPRDNE